MVSGSIHGNKNLRAFLEIVSRLLGYTFDDLDWTAIKFGVDEAERNGEQLEFNWSSTASAAPRCELRRPGESS
jgi:hypothetical protein